MLHEDFFRMQRSVWVNFVMDSKAIFKVFSGPILCRPLGTRFSPFIGRQRGPHARREGLHDELQLVCMWILANRFDWGFFVMYFRGNFKVFAGQILCRPLGTRKLDFNEGRIKCREVPHGDIKTSCMTESWRPA